MAGQEGGAAAAILREPGGVTGWDSVTELWRQELWRRPKRAGVPLSPTPLRRPSGRLHCPHVACPAGESSLQTGIASLFQTAAVECPLPPAGSVLIRLGPSARQALSKCDGENSRTQGAQPGCCHCQLPCALGICSNTRACGIKNINNLGRMWQNFYCISIYLVVKG